MAYHGIPTKAIHEQWLGLVQPVGLVVAPAVLTKLELVPEQRIARLSALQLELAGLLDEVDGVNDQPVKAVSSFRHLATELLEWAEADLLDLEALLAACGPVVPGLAPPGAATDCGVCCVCEAFRLGALVPVSSLAAGVNFSALVGTAAAAGPTRPLVDFSSGAVGLAGLAPSFCPT